MGMGRFWIPDEVEYLRKNYPYTDTRTLSTEMNRSVNTLEVTASRLKIHKVPKPEVKLITTPPTTGEVRKGKEIGLKTAWNYIWLPCEICQKERWFQYYVTKGQPRNTRCYTCAMKAQRGENNANWRGGRYVNKAGYVWIRLSPEDFFYPMAAPNGYVQEHRLVIAKHLGRCLQSWEIVHHKGIRYSDIRNRSDNLEDNLELSTQGSHQLAHSKGYRDGYLKGYTDGQSKALREALRELKAEVRLLRWQLKEKEVV